MTPPLAPRIVPTARGPVEAAVVGPDDPGAPTVLAIHGSPGDWRQARTLAADLRGTHRVVLPSRPGYGATPLRVGRRPAEQAAAYVALLDALEVERAVAVGISGGGPSSYAFAAGHPDRCAGLVLCCAVAIHLPVPHLSAMRRLAAVPGLWRGLTAVARPIQRRALADQDSAAAAMRADLTEREAKLLETDPRIQADLLAFGRDRIEALRGVGLRNDTRQLVAGVAKGARPWPEGVSVPAHVLHSDIDAVVPLAHGEYHASAIPGAVLEVLEGLGHALPISARDRLAEIVRGY